MSHKVLVLDGVDSVCSDILKKRGLEVKEAPKLNGQELHDTIADYEAVVVRSATKVDSELLESAKNLRIIGRAGVGVDNIDVDTATHQGVLVMNTPDGNTISTAEHTCGLILSMARNIPHAVQSLKEGRWDRKKYKGTELDDKKLGVVGLGKIGSNVARRMQAFGMEVLAYDPFTTHEKADELGVQLVELEDIIGQVDFLTVHTPLTDKTRGLISKANAGKIKKGIYLVNCARGGIFEEQDLIPLMDEGIVSGVALDVYTEEPPNDELYELLKDPRIICTPHLGASTEEAQEKVAEQIAEQVADALEQRSFKGSLNGKSIALSTNREVQPFLQVAEQLGKFVSQLAPKNTDKLSITYTGTCAEHSQVLTDSLLKGFLHSDMTVEDKINLINARFHADERGLKISETTSKESKTYNDLITVELNGDAEYKKFSATPFGDDDFRVVDIDGFSIELSLEGDIIIYRNVDRPGMLAATSSTLANDNINIAALSLGRKKDAEAITAFQIDKQIQDKDLDKMRDMDGVYAVKYVSL